MRITCLIASLLLASLAVAQNKSAPSPGVPEPKLPVIDYDACPGSSKPIPNVKLVEDAVIYSSLEDQKEVARLRAGDNVTVLGGANLTRRPDSAVIRYVPPEEISWPPLKVGDTVLGYGWELDGDMVFWAKGIRFHEGIEGVAENGVCGFASGFGPGGCTIDIVKDGLIEWWVKVRTTSGVDGWALAVRYDADNRWYRWDGNFSDVLHDHCNLD